MIDRYNIADNGKIMRLKCDDDKLFKKYEEILKYISK